MYIVHHELPDTKRYTELDMCQLIDEIVPNQTVASLLFKDVWTIWLKSQDAHRKLVDLKSIVVGNVRVELHADYPLQKPIPNEKLTFRDLPFWISNDEILDYLEHFGIVAKTGVISARLRDGQNKLTKFYSGDRFIYVKGNMSQTLHSTALINYCTCRVFHKSQDVGCSRCRRTGHTALEIDTCPAYVVESDIVAIRSPKHVLSNFYTCTVKMFNQEFTSSEQAYQWRFAKYVELDDIAAEIMASRTPAEAKDIASRIPRHLHRDWHSFKHCVMREVLHAKADSCPRFKQELIQTGDRKLVEATRDLFWASGLSPKESASTQPGYYPGLNQLGRVLERVRHELTEEEARIEALNGDEAEKQKQPPQSVRHSTVTRASNDSTQRTRDDPTIQAPDHSARLATDDLIIQAPDNSDRDEADVSTILAPDNTGRHNPDDPTIQAPDDPARHALSNPTNHVPDDPALHVPDDPTINVPDNPTKHVPDDLTEPAPDAMTSPPLIDAIENPSNTSDMIITDSDSSCSELDISGVTKLESTPESAVCSGATDAVPKHRPILKPHGRKNVKDSTGSNLVQTTLSSFLGKMISKRKLTPGKETDTTQENSKSQPNDT